MNFLVRSQNTVKTLVPQYIRKQSIASSANKSEKKGRDEFITMASPNHKQNAKDRLYVWGYAGLGALGESQFLEPYGNRNRIYRQRKPWRLRWVDRVDAKLTHIAAGNGFSLFATAGTKDLKGHQLFGTGMNVQSQIGVHRMPSGEAYKYIIEPVLIHLPFQQTEMKDLKILDISCGRAHSMVLTNLGIISFGNNSYGQCGRPIIENEEYFGNEAVIQNISNNFDIASGDEIVSIKCGLDHTCFLTKSGDVFTCGWASDGQLGQDIYTVNATPRKVAGELQGTRITQIATKGDFVLVLTNEGELFGWGNNEYKQLSLSGFTDPQIGVPRHLKLPSRVQKPIQHIAASGTHCLVIDAAKKVWVWGFGLLGKGPRHEALAEPSQVPDTLFGKYAEIGHSLERCPKSVSCGLNSSCVLMDDGTLYMWGKNEYGNLGIGEDKDVFFPFRVNVPASVKKVDCSPDHTLAICKTFL